MSFLDQIAAKLPFNQKQENAEYYFAVSIGLSEVTATVFGIIGDKIDILGKKTLEYVDTEDLIGKTHQALDSALGALDLEPDKVLFGVPSEWSMDDNLKEPYLKLLSKMLKTYDLSPLAYVTTTNAMSFLIQKFEGAPPTAILLGIGEYIEVTLIKGGKIIGTKSARRGNALFENIQNLLNQFTEVEVLPSKIMLYETKKGENLSKIHDDLMSYPWMQKLSFLHFPKIEVLATDILEQSIIFAGSSELYPDKDLKNGFSLYQKINLSAPEEKIQGLRSLKTDFPKENFDKVAEEEDLGFIKGDIKKNLSESKIKSRKLKKFTAMEVDDLEGDNLISPDEEEQKNLIGYASKPFSALSLYFEKIKMPSGRSLKGKWLKLAIIPILLLILIAGYLTFSKAEVKVLVEPKTIEKEALVVADPKVNKVDEANKIIPGALVETTVTGSDKATATGTKQIGDPAKGKVIIYNRTDNKSTLPSGTVLTSGTGLKFTLDSSVSIASQSSSLGADYKEIIEPGKSEAVGITALAIGPESNLAGGTELTVSSLAKSDIVAKVDEALSGGTSKEVTVVTSDDQKKLQAKLTGALKQKAEADLKSQSKDGKKIIADALDLVDSKFTFSKQIGDQASEFTLNASIRFRGTSYQEADLRTIVSKLVETNVPPNYQMDLSDALTQAEVAKVEKNGKLIFQAKFKAKLIPKLNLEEIKTKIKGQTVEGAINKLREIQDVISGEITLTPQLPSPPALLPFFEKNISVTVAPK